MSKVNYMHSSFSTGKCNEHFFALYSTNHKSFITEAEELLWKYQQATGEHNCSENTEIVLRFHLSDVHRQAQHIRRIFGRRSSFVSFVGQPPANNSRISLEAWHLEHNGIKRYISENNNDRVAKFDLKNYQLLYYSRQNFKLDNSKMQTYGEFVALQKILKRHGGNIADNCMRTWLYCRDVDNNYAGLVEARNELFETYGLTQKTHYIASTGIEGQHENPHRLVGMDSASVFGIDADQVSFMEALKHLSPTHFYGVSFERGTKITYGDRAHYYISGTASINKFGSVVHTDDVEKQTVRTIENIEALLNNYKASLNDIKLFTVYLRDGADHHVVDKILEKSLPYEIPRVMQIAPVCRPEWLVEIEAVAVNSDGNNQFRDFA